LAVNNEDMKALVDAFELDYLPAPLQQLAREVSRDDGDAAAHQLPILPPPSLPRGSSSSSNHLFSPTPPQLRGMQAQSVGENVVPVAPCHARMNRSPHIGSGDGDLFSPSTDDMRTTWEYSTADHVPDDDEEDEYEDLRRQVGSNDYDEEEEHRDGPVQSGRNEAEGVSKFSQALASCCSIDEEDCSPKRYME
jgi:hypothetical protein